MRVDESPYEASRKSLDRGDRLTRALVACVLGCTAGLSFTLHSVSGLMPECLFHELTGVSCLTCGMTRSLEAAAHGKLAAAVQFHLMGPVVLAGVIMACLLCAVEALTGRRLFRLSGWYRPVLVSVATVWIVYGIVRMIVEL